MEVDVDLDVVGLIDAIDKDELEAIYEDLFLLELMRYSKTEAIEVTKQPEVPRGPSKVFHQPSKLRFLKVQ